ncbi:MAG: GGDEF domain-containing protein [Bacillota bacterium]|nr:GGDEF domain-containing protein [Bacillota bacterium]
MEVFLRIDINIAAMVLLGIVLITAYKRLDRQDSMNQKFLNTSLIILLELLFETITCIINKRPEKWLEPVADVMHICLFVTAPILTYYWVTFVHSWVEPNTSISPKRLKLLKIPVVINTVITVLSPFFGYVFYIDSSNVYHRGSLFALTSFITYFYLLCGVALIIRHRRKIIKQDFTPLIVFGVLPSIGGVCQALFYGVLLMWSSGAFSLVIAYVFLEQRMIHIDYLTGAMTRESFECFISQKMRQKANAKFGAIYLDLDGLKEINDKYGHLEGDYAIKTTIQLIKGLLRKTDIVARLGGDEFIIVLDCEKNENLVGIITKIILKLDDYNEKSKKGYRLECSFGADIFDTSYTSIEQFLHHIDDLMYSNKRRRKLHRTEE